MLLNASSIYIRTSRAHSQMTILPDSSRPDLILKTYSCAFFFIRQAKPSTHKVIFATILSLEKSLEGSNELSLATCEDK
jgi:hypothetical protein